jgi:hypothetical protein
VQAPVSEWPSRPDVAAVAARRRCRGGHHGALLTLVGPAGAEFARNDAPMACQGLFLLHSGAWMEGFCRAGLNSV